VALESGVDLHGPSGILAASIGDIRLGGLVEIDEPELATVA